MDFVKNEDKDYNNVIIIDDMGAYLKDYEVEKQLKDLILIVGITEQVYSFWFRVTCLFLYKI